MSNFDNFGNINNAKMGSAPQFYTASTPDNLATITTAGYMNDKSRIVKPNDHVHINYLDTSTFPLNTGMNATYGYFKVTYTAPNWNLVQVTTAGG